MKILDAITIAAATARLSALIAQDEITEPIRQKIGQWAIDADYGSARERIHYLVTCTRCTSIWAAGIVLTLWAFPAGQAIVRLLATSETAITLLTVVDRLET